jgi:hypothetical protein
MAKEVEPPKADKPSIGQQISELEKRWKEIMEKRKSRER